MAEGMLLGAQDFEVRLKIRLDYLDSTSAHRPGIVTDPQVASCLACGE